jgi:hypothetical protein
MEHARRGTNTILKKKRIKRPPACRTPPLSACVVLLLLLGTVFFSIPQSQSVFLSFTCKREDDSVYRYWFVGAVDLTQYYLEAYQIRMENPDEIDAPEWEIVDRPEEEQDEDDDDEEEPGPRRNEDGSFDGGVATDVKGKSKALDCDLVRKDTGFYVILRSHIAHWVFFCLDAVL